MNIEQIAHEIYILLGPGYSERVYHNAMEVSLRELGIHYESGAYSTYTFQRAYYWKSKGGYHSQQRDCSGI